MNTTELLLAAGVILLALGAGLLLPHRYGQVKPWRVQLAGAALAAAGLVALALTWSTPADLITRGFFYAFALIALIAGLLTVTSRDPVFNALSFALVLLATSALFLLVDAQFLAAGTIIVYAGAIVVTFLFVIMLAQAEGEALYDRMARSPGLTTLVSFLFFGALVFGLNNVQNPPTRGRGTGSIAAPAPSDPNYNAATDTGGNRRAVNLVNADIETRLVQTANLRNRVAHDPAARRVLELAQSPTNSMAYVDQVGDPARGVPHPHVAGLGGTLYTDHLVTVELVGAVLFIALVGAVSIGLPRHAVHAPGPR